MAGESSPEYETALHQEHQVPFVLYPDTDPKLWALIIEDAEMCTELAADDIEGRAAAAAQTGARNNYEAEIASFVLNTLNEL